MKVNMINNLKRCPFCGKQPEIKRTIMKDGYYVMCFNPDCKTMVTTQAMPTEKAAIELWNRRDGE